MKTTPHGLARRSAAALGPCLSFLVAATFGVAAATAQSSPSAEGSNPRLQPFAELARAVEASLGGGACQPELMNSALDMDLLLQRTLSGLEVKSDLRMGFGQGLSRSLKFGSVLCQQVDSGAAIKLLRVRQVDDQVQALFRLLAAGGGVNYHDMKLARLPEGDVKVVDIYIYLAGEWLSETLRRSLLPAVAEANRGLLDKILSKNDNAWLANLDRVQQISEHLRAGQFTEALAVYDQLPAEVQRDKTVLLQRMLAAQNVSDETYTEALTAIKKTFPDDPAIGLTLIDYHLMREEYDTAFELIERIDEAVGGDPYQDVLRANCRYSQGRLDEAKKAAWRAIRDEPELEDAYWTAVTVSLDQKSYGETAQLLDLLTERLGIEMADLTEVPEYAGFVASPQYRTWLAKRGQ